MSDVRHSGGSDCELRERASVNLTQRTSGRFGWRGALATSLGLFGVALSACSGHTAQNQTQSGGASASGGANTSGSVSSSKGGGAMTSGGAGGVMSPAGAGTSGNASAAGGALPSAGQGGQLNTAGASGGGAGGMPNPTDISKVKPSLGCGKDPMQATATFVKYTIQTSGTKDADCADKLNNVPKCGAWSVPRDYYIWLPPTYDKQHAYPLVLQAPGCGGNGTQVYPLSPTNSTDDAGVNGTVIRVGLTPAPNSIGHGTNENQGCFDDKEGDDSVDFVFYENLLDKLKTELCYDENRVFAVGNSSGAWLANELLCKYGGDTRGYAMRGVLTSQGGLPTEPKWTPKCTSAPVAGAWVYEIGDTTDTFPAPKFAIARAMKANGCQAFDVDTAQLEDFPIGGAQPSSTCKRILGCPKSEPYPLIVCALPGTAHGSHDEVVNPAFAAFTQLLAPP
jgi:polyhydroxybutyrate depolymerase